MAFVGASQLVLVVKNPPANAGDRRRFDPWVGKIPWRRAWQHTPVFLPGESHGQRSLEGSGPWFIRVGHDWSDLVCTHAVCSVMSESLWLYGLQGARGLASQAPPSIEFSRQDIPECVALFSSRASSQPRDRTHISCIAGRFFTTAASGKTRLTLIIPSTVPWREVLWLHHNNWEGT